MRKRLLTATMALLCAVTGFAFETGDYVLTKTQRFKITGENLVRNGDFSDAMNGWHGDALSAAPSSTVWDVVATGEGPEGESVLKSLDNATEGAPFTGIVSGLEVDESYVFTAMVKATDKFTTGTDVAAANCFSVFLTTGEEHLTKADGDSIVAAAVECAAGEWTQVAFYFVNKMGGNDASITRDKLVIYLNKLPKDVMITNIGLYKAEEVYDIRILQKRLAYIRQLMAEPNFDTADAAEAKGSLQEVITGMEEAIEANGLDDISEGEAAIASLNEAFETFLDASSENMSSYFSNIDIVSVPKYNRGAAQTANGKTYGNWRFYGDNWYHSNKSDEWTKYIGPGAKNHNTAGTVALWHNTLPAGKYFVSAEIRNGLAGSNWSTRWEHIDADIIGYLGKGKRETNNVNFGTIEGEEWSHLYFVLDLEEGAEFEAGFWWNAPDITNPSGVVYMKNFEVRSFTKGVADIIARNNAWSKFKPQYDAIIAARKNMETLQGDKTMPWGKDSLDRAAAIFNPYYDALMAKGWVDGNGEDTGVATNDQLTDFEKTHGLTEEQRTAFGVEAFLQYPLSRGYDYASNYVKAQNQSITNLADEIKKAQEILADPMNGQGDKTTFQNAINAAQQAYDDLLAAATADSKETDDPKFVAATTTLVEAEEAFKKSAKLEPIINIDFTGATVEKVTPTSADPEVEAPAPYYVIKGQAGEVTFKDGTVQTNYALTDNDQWNSWLHAIGYMEYGAGMLHIGNDWATVYLPEKATANDVLRFNFDLFYGQLGSCFTTVEFLGSDSTTVVASFSRDSYNGVVGVNTFDNTVVDEFGNRTFTKEGMDLSVCPSQHDKNGIDKVTDDANRSSFEIIIDRKLQGIHGSITTGNGNSSNGIWIALPELADQTISAIRFGQPYNKNQGSAYGRRSWMDNLVVYKYASNAEGPMVAKVKGDVNGNNEVNALDIQEVINAIVAGNNDAKYDVNGDNEVNALDIQEIINIIVGAQSK